MEHKSTIDTTHRLLTESEAARRLQVCAKTLYNARRRGELRYVRLGQCIRYDPADLEVFIEQQKRLGDTETQSEKNPQRGEDDRTHEEDFA
jgi:excisionase family DNA binding protein